MITPQQKGRDFERELAEELGLSLVPGSGNQWWAKLDLKGVRARWSLKYTESNSFPLRRVDFEEALDATTGLQGDGSTSIFAVRMEGLPDDFVMMWKNDFIQMQAGELKFVGEDPTPKKSEVRRARSRVPVLMREMEDENG